MQDQIAKLQEKIANLEANMGQFGYSTQRLVTSELKKSWVLPSNPTSIFGMILGLVVDTADPLQQGRVRFFTPQLHAQNTPTTDLPWASPISSMGGFDDSGLSWVPPAGSTISLIFDNGLRDAPYYLGTIWQRTRNAVNNNPNNTNSHGWGTPFSEYDDIYEGHRNGYWVGPDDGSQAFPPWNTESYNGFDADSPTDVGTGIDNDKTTYPNIFGFKTPQKHMLKMVDGNYKCNHKGKRVELMSSGGNWMIFKDDHLHDGLSIANPKDVSRGPGVCDGETTDCGSVSKDETANPFFKSKVEGRPFKGPQTPENNKCELSQSGIQFLSVSGHSFVLDDSVDEPSGIPNWERGLESFDFGCNDIYKGKTTWSSSTGHKIKMDDEEQDSKTRSENNGISLTTASGNKIDLNDHTEGELAGAKRGISMQTTSNHTLEMLDEDNEQKSEDRKSGGIPISKAKKAFVKIKSGYGLQIELNDSASQESTDAQFIQLFAPQKDNTDAGPHILRMQESATQGQVFFRIGGDYICSSYNTQITIAGSTENPADIMTISSRHNIQVSEKFYYNVADVQAFIAKQAILLLAGDDCSGADGSAMPCPCPVVVYGPKGLQISDRVFASASKDASCVSIFQLSPFHDC